MSKPKEVPFLQDLARETIGDGKSPNLYFVTDQGVTVTVTRDADLAYAQWQQLSRRFPRVESALEDRKTGVLASVEPEHDGSAKLVVFDDFEAWTH